MKNTEYRTEYKTMVKKIFASTSLINFSRVSNKLGNSPIISLIYYKLIINIFGISQVKLHLTSINK